MMISQESFSNHFQQNPNASKRYIGIHLERELCDRKFIGRDLILQVELLARATNNLQQPWFSALKRLFLL
jgi:hypothetical protein